MQGNIPQDLKNQPVSAGSPVGAIYKGATPLDETTVIFTLDGDGLASQLRLGSEVNMGTPGYD